jgi:DNA-binding response OmpR family regulator
MALIVVCEDDASTRTLITAVLSKAGHQVEAFDNGLKGYARLLEGDAELLISDVQMPGKDGFALVAQVREDKRLMEMPCILLTSLQERAHMRIGMTSGADDYVTKPFQPSELLDAVNSQLKRAMQLHILHVDETLRTVDAAVGQRTNELMEMYEKRLQRELQSRWARTDTSSTELRGSLIACSLLQQDTWLQALSSSQMADFAKQFFNKVADSAALFNAEHLQFVGDGLLIVFDASKDTPSMHHAGRARKLLQSMGTIRSSMQAYVQEHLAPAGSAPLPHFACSMVLHEGQLSLGKLDGVAGGIEQLVPVGQDVQLLSKLIKAAQSLNWPALFSPAAAAHWKSVGLEQSYSDQRDAKIGEQTLRLYRAE